MADGLTKYFNEEKTPEKGGTDDLKGNDNGIYTVPCGPNGPVEPAREKVLVACLTPASLAANVYTVTGDPATRLEIINDGAGDLTVTITDNEVDKVKVLKPDDVWDPDCTAITKLTFSAGAVFRADLYR